MGLRFIVVEAYAKAYKFYVKKNKFINLKKDDNKLKKLEKIIKTNPEDTFYLYQDVTKIQD